MNTAKSGDILTNEMPFFIHKHIVNSYPLHWHDFYEIEFVISQSIINTVLNNPIEIVGSDCFMYLPHTYHYYKEADGGADTIIYNAAFAGSFISEDCMACFMNKFENRAIWADKALLPFLQGYMTRLLTLFNENAEKNKHIIKSLLETLIYELCEGSSPIEDDADAGNVSVLDCNCRLLTYIESNFNRKLNLSVLANIVHISPKYFSSYFKRNFAITYRQYITQLRMNLAMNILCDAANAMSINSICNAVGYESASNFVKIFTHYYGNPPKYYRQTLK